VGNDPEGRTGHGVQVIVVQVEDTQVGQPRKGGGVDGTNPILTNVQLFQLIRLGEEPRRQLLQKVLAQ